MMLVTWTNLGNTESVRFTASRFTAFRCFCEFVPYFVQLFFQLVDFLGVVGIT